MCTVSYVPLVKGDFILTSNRDETPLRETILPKTYLENGVELSYPKDALAGGTWIGVSALQRLVCLLNGAFEKHQRTPPYAKSRGLIVKELLTTSNIEQWVSTADFFGVEPFTIVCVDWSEGLVLYELVWDGSEKHFLEKSQAPTIWSSSPLYTPEMKAERHAWFYDFIQANDTLTSDKLVAFHSNSKQGTTDNAILMKRLFVETVSITSVTKQGDQITLWYQDLKSNTTSRLVL